MTERQLRDMKLHQIKHINDETVIIRVVGGIIYIITNETFSNSIFVPFNRNLLDPDLL